MQLKSMLGPSAGNEAVRRLEERVAALEEDLAALRRHNLRLAELTDVVQELLVPLASRDEARVAGAIERFRQSL
ncbi:conserved hypothetical protein [Nocardioides sp. AX2bis]|nr:conserved hypothetical protein [Nocardioides sp. AX2bis]